MFKKLHPSSTEDIYKFIGMHPNSYMEQSLIYHKKLAEDAEN